MALSRASRLANRPFSVTTRFAARHVPSIPLENGLRTTGRTASNWRQMAAQSPCLPTTSQSTRTAICRKGTRRSGSRFLAAHASDVLCLRRCRDLGAARELRRRLALLLLIDQPATLAPEPNIGTGAEAQRRHTCRV